MKRLLQKWVKVTISVIVLFCGFYLTQAQRNDFFYAKYDGQGKVYFQWFFDNSQNNVESFVIYKAEGAYKEFGNDEFKVFKKLSLNEVKYEKNGLFSYVADDKLEKEEYSYALIINLKDGGIVKSAPFIVFNNFEPPHKGIFFESEPVRIAYLNKEYKYQAKAESFPDDNLEIVYKLMKGPDGMKIDYTTGLITWTPTQKINNVFVSIAAYAKNNSKMIAYQDFEIYIFNCENPVIISGKITDKNDKLVQHGYVHIIPSDATNSHKPVEPNFYGSEVVNGEYRIEADAGTYFMFFYDEMGRTFLYNNANKIENAAKITLQCGQNKIIDWKINNLSNNYYSVTGQVKDENGKGVPFFPVIFESVPSGEINIPENYFSLSAMTDENGYYEVKLPENFTFIAFIHMDKANAMKNIPMILFYKQTFKREEATKLFIDKNYTGIDFQFTKNPDFIFRVVTGKVVDKDDKPIPGAMVNFEGFNDKTNKDGYYKYFDAVKTDQNGVYKIELPDMFKYVAYVININSIDKNKDYRALFYKQTYDREKATILTLDKDLSGIDFKFDISNTSPTYQSVITGKVFNYEGTPIHYAFVEAIRLENGDIDYSEKSHFAYTDANGYYAFKGLKAGKYVVFASTQKTTEFSCGYYVAGSVATINFDDATRIELDGKNIIQNIDINLPKFEIKQGGGIIKGEIYNQRNFDEANKSANAIAAAKIYLKENQNALVTFDESNANGSFVITGVPSGEFTFTIEKPGFKKFEKIITVDESNITDLGVIMLEPLAINSVEDPFQIITNIFPNPAATELTIQFTLQNSIEKIEIIDQQGKSIPFEFVYSLEGNNNIKVNISNLPSGKYYAVITNDDKNYAIPFIVNR